MKPILKTAFVFIPAMFFLTGCAELNQGAREVGKPVGSLIRTPQSLTEGVAEGYTGNSNSNPYGR